MKTVWKVLGSIGLLIVIVFAGSIGKMVGKSTVQNYSEGKKEGAFEEVLTKTASQINGRLPVMVDKETRLDSTVGGPGKKFTYLCTLVNFSAQEISWQHFSSTLSPNIRNSVCSSKEMEVFVKNGVQVVYNYRGKNGVIVGDIVVNPSDCNF
jgi:hypothetical protein